MNNLRDPDTNDQMAKIAQEMVEKRLRYKDLVS